MEHRKVIFWIVKADFGLFDHSDDEKGSEDFKERRGFFHEWGLVIENSLQKTCAIIEEEGTGKIFMIDPENVQFLK